MFAIDVLFASATTVLLTKQSVIQFNPFSPLALLWWILLWVLLCIVSNSLSSYFYLWKVQRRATSLNARLAPTGTISGIRAGFLTVKYLTKLDGDQLPIMLEPGLSGELHTNNKSTIYNFKEMGPYSALLVKDPEIIRQMMSHQGFTKFGRGKSFQSTFKNLLRSICKWYDCKRTVTKADVAHILSTIDPDQTWKYHRNLIKPFFSKKRTRNVRIDRIDNTISQFLEHSKSNGPIDVSSRILKMMFGISLEYFFGFTYDESKEEIFREHMHAFDKMKENALFRALGPLGSLIELLPGYSSKKSNEVLTQLVDSIVEEAINKSKARGNADYENSPENEDSCFFDYLATQTNDRKVLHDTALNILFAARDTTATLMTGALYKFAENENIFKKVREEVLRLFGNDSVPDDQNNRRDCKLLDAVLKETLRMFPSAPMLERFCHEDTVLSSLSNERYFIPQGTVLHMSIWLLHRDKSWWGEDADKWDPYRWLDSRNEKVKNNPSIYMPFSQGPRICPGQEQGQLIATVFLIRFCQAFEKIERAKDVQPAVSPVCVITTNWKDGMWLRMTPSKSSS